jgi:3-hydroxy-9,10-secoandrosta-1,3,5(10)-triene-9,17-dione monooxygenase reductase component
MNAQAPVIDPIAFRSAMGCFLTGVTIVTSAGAQGPTGMTVNSLTSVSLVPCQILVCLKLDSLTGASIRESGRFAVNLLANDQKDLAMRFARPAPNRFEGADYTLDEHGVPLLGGALAHLVCDLDCVHVSGDHDIFIGNVRACGHAAVEPLAFFKGRMCDVAMA